MTTLFFTCRTSLISVHRPSTASPSGTLSQSIAGRVETAGSGVLHLRNDDSIRPPSKTSSMTSAPVRRFIPHPPVTQWELAPELSARPTSV
jgi:hypothetical protein